MVFAYAIISVKQINAWSFLMILITGGSGFVGSNLIPELIQNNFKVRCLVLNDIEVKKVEQYKVKTVVGNVANPKSLIHAMDGVDTIIHMVAILREHGRATFEGVNVHGTNNMIQEARDSGVKRFIHIGILGANKDPKYRYLHSKWLGMKAVEESGLDYTILKPSVMFGPQAGFIEALMRSIKMFPLLAPIAGSGKTLLQPIWVKDVAKCIVKAAKGEKIGQSCEIGGPEHFTYEQVMDIVMAAAGIKRTKIHIPIALMRPVVTIMDKLSSDPPITRDELDALGLNNVTQPDAVESQFGFKPLSIVKGLSYLNK
jgi:NADH dehydrogenase